MGSECEHKFVHLRSEKVCDWPAVSFVATWTLRDVFFCERCLEEKTKEKCETSRKTPDWYAAAGET